MKISDFVLLTLRYSEKSMIAGRTLFQKTLYFIEERMKLDFGFVAHYYGPYSSQITEEIANLCAAGIIEENSDTLSSFSFGASFEPRKYTYSLTQKGQEVAQLVEEKNKSEANNVKKILTTMKELGAVDDYKSLSVAAKMHHILKSSGREMKPSEILTEAKVLEWNISKEEAEAAVAFLTAMDLVKVKRK